MNRENREAFTNHQTIKSYPHWERKKTKYNKVKITRITIRDDIEKLTHNQIKYWRKLIWVMVIVEIEYKIW